MTAPPLKIDRHTCYITPTGRLCRWQPPGDADAPGHELTFLYIDTSRPGESFALSAQLAQRLLKARPRLGLGTGLAGAGA